MIAYIFLLGHLLFAIGIFFFTIAFVTGAPFVPSSKKTAETMIRLAHIRPGMNIYDLGAGDGRLLFLAAQKGATAIGLEINPFLVLFTWLKIRLQRKQKSIHVYWKNFWQGDFHDADIVFIYLIAWKMERLEDMLLQTCRPGTIIVSNSFIFPRLHQIRSEPDHHVYVFTVPQLTKTGL